LICKHRWVATAIVREADPGDVEEVVSGYEWLFAPPGSRPPDWNPDRAAGAVRRALASDAAVVLVAALDGEIVGLCTAYDDIESVRFGRRVWVEDLAVHPDRRSLGIGKQLLDEAKRWARSRGATHLELDSAEARTDAHRFYERQGSRPRSFSFGWDL
jgi:GNAT superfamily N-acetyltransferase